MSSSFFTVPGKKRKRAPVVEAPKKRVANSKSKSTSTAQTLPAPRKQAEQHDDDISSGSEGEDGAHQEEAPESDSDSEDEGQTAAERRLALAERYLDNVREEVNEVGFDAEEIDRDLIAERLGEDVSEAKGKVYKRIASELAFDRASHSLFRANTFTTTSIAICPPFAYTVHKDKVLIKWKLQDLPANQYPQTTKKKPKKVAPPRRKPIKVAILKGNAKKAKDKNYKGHIGEILCVAASENGKYVVTGGADKRLIVYDAKSLRPIRFFTHHRDAITSLAFRRGTNQLYSASRDRTVKVWSIDNLAYETLYGHADEVVDIDALALERCVTVGARDRTARLWKVVEETQLVFRGGAVDKKPKPGIDPRSLAHEGSMDCVAMIDEECFVTGSDNGSISLWSLQKKKPLHTISYAHGFNPHLRPTEASAEVNPDPKCVPPPQPRNITALRTLPYSDLIFSGSWDGYIRVWRLGEQKRTIEPVGILSKPSPDADHQLNGTAGADSDNDEDDSEGEANGANGANPAPYHIKGVVNDIALFERGDRGKDGLCVVAAVGKEHKLGRWIRVNKGRNGAVVFEVPRIKGAKPPPPPPAPPQQQQQQQNGVVDKKSSKD